jgi:predicted AAA+ superfamily ATPase
MEKLSKINKEFAQQLLTVLYRLDKPIGQIDEAISDLASGPEKEKLIEALGELMGEITSDLMVPIYHEQPSLGSASEPGEWLDRDAD